MKKANVTSHVLVVALVAGVLILKLTAGAVAGFLVYTVSMRVKAALERRSTRMHARGLALALVISTVVITVLGAAIALWQLVKGHGVADVSAMLVDGLGRMHSTVPASLDHYLPASVDDAKNAATDMIRKNAEQLSAVGMGTLRGGAHVLVGLITGAMLAWNEFAPPQSYRPLSRALLERFATMREAFERVVFAQVKISLLNTSLSALYLKVVLPVAGIHVPFGKTLIALTFVAGLLPVVGNLVSNTMIVLVSLAVSFNAAVAALGYLVLIHKLEYFVNARIVGHRIDAKAWEILLVMAAFEAIAGLPGLVLAPVLYAYAKSELKRAGLIGRHPDAKSQGIAPRSGGFLKRAILVEKTGEGMLPTLDAESHQ